MLRTQSCQLVCSLFLPLFCILFLSLVCLCGFGKSSWEGFDPIISGWVHLHAFMITIFFFLILDILYFFYMTRLMAESSYWLPWRSVPTSFLDDSFWGSLFSAADVQSLFSLHSADTTWLSPRFLFPSLLWYNWDFFVCNLRISLAVFKILTLSCAFN